MSQEDSKCSQQFTHHFRHTNKVSRPAIPILRRLRQGVEHSRTAWAIDRDSVSRKKGHRGRMAQLVKALAAKSHDQSLMPVTHIVERDNQD